MTGPAAVETVIKVGGSVLRDEADYRAIADRLRPWLDRGTWVVVSAGRGVTDELERLARERRPEAVPGLIARHARWAGRPLPPDAASELAIAVRDASLPAADIVSWGERASAAALQARLLEIGSRVPVEELPVRGLPPRHPAAIVPGYYVRDLGGRVRLLPRGGSDISAVLLASRLGARRVRLWKDGGGLRGASDSTVPEVDGEDLLGRLRGTIRPLHPAALRVALRAGLDLFLEDPFDRLPSTVVRSRPWSAAVLGPVPDPPGIASVTASREVPWEGR